MTDALSRVNYRKTPQSEQAREDQVKNNAGGYTFTVTEATRLNRFLTLGTDGGTYYVKERELTKKNADIVIGMAKASNPLLIEQAVAISQAGRAPRNNAALFALAAAASLGSTEYKRAALDALPLVARTGSHMLTFVGYVEQFRGWGPMLTKAVGRWYFKDDMGATAYQLLKYQQRDGWSQRDVLRLSHMGRTSLSPAQKALYAHFVKGEKLPALDEFPLLEAVRDAFRDQRTDNVVSLIEANHGLSWEMLPSEVLGKPEVWQALFNAGNLPMGAMLRNLARMTSNGALAWNSDFTSAVCAKLTDPAYLAKARIHPIAVLLALKTYSSGHGVRGKGSWSPLAQVTDALNDAFYASFKHVEPTGKRILVALDVSGSMGAPAGGLPVTCREVCAAMAMTQVRTEPKVLVVGFTSGATGYGGQWGGQAELSTLNISARQRLDDVVNYTARLPFGGTDCALPMVWAKENKVEVDTIQVWTDNETWAGSIHPHQALREYRQKTGIGTRLQVVAITPTEFSIADPRDPGQLDVAGFDAAVPALLVNHSRGDI